MIQLKLSTAQSLQLPVPLAQQLARLAHQQGLVGELDRYSPDLLAGMRVKSQQAAAAHNDDPRHGFNYGRALHHLAKLSPNQALDAANVCDLHRQLNLQGGQWRHVKRKITRPSGNPEQTATTTRAIEPALNDLLAKLDESLSTGLDPLIAIPLFSLDLMRIFPFLDGNRRVSLLLTRYLLSRHGHPVMAFVDLESEVAAAEKSFYQSLDHSSQADQPPLKWLAFWWVVLMRVYQRFTRQIQQAAISPGRGAKTALVEHFIEQQKGPFLFTDISAALPTIGTDMIRVVLRKLRDQGIIKASGRGRGTTWSVLGE